MKSTVRCISPKARSWAKITGFLLAIMMVFTPKVEASHLAGGEITYRHISGNNYEITLNVYRDCRGVSLGSAYSISNNCGVSISVSRTAINDITPVCPGTFSRCSGGSGLGYEEHVYKRVVTINPNLSSAECTLGWTLCCRNGAITTLSSASSNRMYVNTTLNRNLSPRNSSPSFLNPPVAILCVGQPATISPNASDVDGDALQYSLTTCRQTSPTTSVTYGPGFSPTNPLATTSGLTLDPFTGLLTFTPSQIQVGVVCTKVEEFRGGTKIGEINRDIQINVVNCNNNNPVVANIPNQIAQVGVQLCVNVSATDADNDNITLTATSAVGTYTNLTASPGSATGQFCFTPTLAMQGQTFTVTINAQDDACPTPGTAAETFNITVPAVSCSLSVSATGTDASCGVSDGTATATQTGGVAPLSFSWSNGQTGATATGLAPGTYTVTVVDGYNCVETASVTIGGGVGTVASSASTQSPTCPNTNDGSISVSASGGTAPYSFSLNGGAAQGSSTFSGLGIGTYTIDVSDVNGCTANTITVVLTANDNIAPILNCPSNITVNNEAGLCGAPVTYTVSATDNCPGSVTVSRTAGQGSGSFFAVGTTTESYSATDAFGNSASCSFTVTVVDAEAPVMNCPADITVNNDAGVCGAAVSYSTSESDNCPGVTSGQVAGQASGTTFQVGTTTNTYTARDAAGNTASCSFNVTVVDNEAPSITCPADISLECRRDVPAADAGTASASDNCGVAGIAHVGDADNGGSGCAGDPFIITRTYEATDIYGNTATCEQTITVEATPILTQTSPNAIVFPAFQDSSCATISVAAMGGCPGYTYQWSNGSTSASQQVCPTSTTVYTVTVTDAEGCSAVDDVKVCVVDVFCTSRTNNGVGGTGQSGNGINNSPNAMVHIAMCHIPPGNPANAMTKCLPIPAAQAHMAAGHGGDHLGACGTLASRTCDASTQKSATPAQSVILSGRIDAFPNPFETSANIVVNFDEATTGTISVYNLQGQVVAQLFNGQIDNSVTVEFDGSNMPAGIYVVRVVTDNGYVMHKKLTLQK